MYICIYVPRTLLALVAPLCRHMVQLLSHLLSPFPEASCSSLDVSELGFHVSAILNTCTPPHTPLCPPACGQVTGLATGPFKGLLVQLCFSSEVCLASSKTACISDLVFLLSANLNSCTQPPSPFCPPACCWVCLACLPLGPGRSFFKRNQMSAFTAAGQPVSLTLFCHSSDLSPYP